MMTILGFFSAAFARQVSLSSRRALPPSPKLHYFQCSLHVYPPLYLLLRQRRRSAHAKNAAKNNARKLDSRIHLCVPSCLKFGTSLPRKVRKPRRKNAIESEQSGLATLPGKHDLTAVLPFDVLAVVCLKDLLGDAGICWYCRGGPSCGGSSNTCSPGCRWTH
jgi:hypothetical protein